VTVTPENDAATVRPEIDATTVTPEIRVVDREKIEDGRNREHGWTAGF